MGLVYDQLRPDERMLIDAAKRIGLDLKPYDSASLSVQIYDGDGRPQLSDLLLLRCMSYFRNLHLAAALESQGVPVINSFEAISTCGNKVFGTLRLRKAGVPMPKTLLAFSEKGALDAFDKVGYPAIMKPVVGSWGRLVSLVKDPDVARSLMESRQYMHPIQQIYYIQENIAHPGRDIRCFVIGERAVAAMYRYPPKGDWRTNAARGGSVKNCPITPELEKISVKAALAMGGGAFGVDLMESERGLLVHEVNATTEFKNLVEASKVDIPKLLLEYATEQMKR